MPANTHSNSFLPGGKAPEDAKWPCMKTKWTKETLLENTASIDVFNLSNADAFTTRSLPPIGHNLASDAIRCLYLVVHQKQADAMTMDKLEGLYPVSRSEGNPNVLYPPYGDPLIIKEPSGRLPLCAPLRRHHPGWRIPILEMCRPRSLEQEEVSRTRASLKPGSATVIISVKTSLNSYSD